MSEEEMAADLSELEEMSFATLQKRAEDCRAVAGREMDADIAEKVMGLTLANPARTFVEIPGTTEPCSLGEMTEVAFLPPYSTDLAAAWVVVERLRATGSRGWHVRVDTEGRDHWTCMVWDDPEDNPIGFGYSTNPALAICLAALTAVAEASA